MQFSERISLYSPGIYFHMKKGLWRILSQLSLECISRTSGLWSATAISSTSSRQILCSGLDSHRLLEFFSLVYFQNRHRWEVWGWSYQCFERMFLPSPWYIINKLFLYFSAWCWAFERSSGVGVSSPAHPFLRSSASEQLCRYRAIFVLADATEQWWYSVPNSPLEI